MVSSPKFSAPRGTLSGGGHTFNSWGQFLLVECEWNETCVHFSGKFALFMRTVLEQPPARKWQTRTIAFKKMGLFMRQPRPENDTTEQLPSRRWLQCYVWKLEPLALGVWGQRGVSYACLMLLLNTSTITPACKGDTMHSIISKLIFKRFQYCTPLSLS